LRNWKNTNKTQKRGYITRTKKGKISDGVVAETVTFLKKIKVR